MGAAAYGGGGFEGRAAVGGERPIGAASCRQQHNRASCQNPHPLPHHPMWQGCHATEWGHNTHKRGRGGGGA